ncbi:MAG: hypothetical protein LQ351_005133 [Letrouitia transgressa]|nr:MAG: hypothetical protein LQ351_005133 [Letrouitia transgressa]
MASLSSSLPLDPTPSTVQLETLVTHLVASKRSLSSIEQVWQANQLVTSTRKSLETSVVTSARTSFLRHGISSQLLTLDQVLLKSREVENEGAREYSEATRTLDIANRRLKSTLDELRNTLVDAHLRPPDVQDTRSLLDFVDESGVENLDVTTQESIKAANAAHEEFVESNRTFSKDLERVRKQLTVSQQRTLETVTEGNGDGPRHGSQSDLVIPDILGDMEDRAKDMADNLESLVKHFDLCVTAIKHTEGGGDAARRITDDLPVGMDVGQYSVQAPSEPISDEEKKEMMEVLENDAHQVEDVVIEIRDSFTAIENLHTLVSEQIGTLEREHASIISAFRLLEEIGARLQPLIGQSEIFAMRWDSEKSKIDEHIEELENLSSFYDGFLSAYDNLLVEIGRRQFMEQRMEKVVQDTMIKVDKLYEEDLEAREAFKKEQGDFLPVDIWPGLTDSPLRFEISTANSGNGRAPEISKSVIQNAIRRVRGRC